jgi:peptidyl-prolyl cis-trans isomerase SurA
MKTILLSIILPFTFLLNNSLNKTATIVLIKKDAKKLAEYYRQRVLRGENMASLAKLYSEDPGSASNGGQYDGIIKGMMVPAFEKVAFSLVKPGDISEVFETEYGFHFIQLISRKGETLSLRHILITRD